jgi:uncharacterized protein (TIGR03083 family)
MTPADTRPDTDLSLAAEVSGEFLALADLLEAAPPEAWEAPSLCEGWRTREVVAHMTMPARYDGPQFMERLAAAGGDFTAVSDAVAAEDGALPVATLLENLRSEVLHAWEPPGGGAQGALTHCVIHGLDITEGGAGLGRRVPENRIARVLAGAGDVDLAQVFGTDVAGVELRADDLDWSYGSGELVIGPAQVLALVLCGRRVPEGRLTGPHTTRFTRGSPQR